MADAAEIEVIVFEQASGNVRGSVNAFMPVKGKAKRIAHATLLVNEQPAVSLNVPQNLTLDEIEAVAANLNSFVAKVRELAKAD